MSETNAKNGPDLPGQTLAAETSVNQTSPQINAPSVQVGQQQGGNATYFYSC